MDVFDRTVFSDRTQVVECAEISSYGVFDAEPVTDGRTPLPGYEPGGKAEAEEAPSNLAIIGRYVLTPEIFDSLRDIKPGAAARSN